LDATLYAKLTQIFREVFEDEGIVLNPQSTADMTQGWDSLRHVRLMLTVEKTFDVKFAASEMVRVKNAADLVHLIERKLPRPVQA
jgi:acyl carrier protein